MLHLANQFSGVVCMNFCDGVISIWTEKEFINSCNATNEILPRNVTSGLNNFGQHGRLKFQHQKFIKSSSNSFSCSLILIHW